MLLRIAELVEVKFDYDAEEPEESTLCVGDIIKSYKLVEDEWMKGEMSCK